MTKTSQKSAWLDPEDDVKSNSSEKVRTKRRKPFLVGLVLGSLFACVALAAMAVVYEQDSHIRKTTVTTTTSTTSTTTTTTSTTTTTTTTTTTSTTSTTTTTTTSTTTSTTSTTSSALPAQCFSYTTNTDATRNVGYASSSICDTGIFGSGTWVRFMSPAGTIIPTSAPSIYYCGTSAPGWYNGPYPSSAGSTTTGTVCYYWSGNTCNWSNSIQITNCDTFYVFLLVDTPVCTLRYCAV